MSTRQKLTMAIMAVAVVFASTKLHGGEQATKLRIQTIAEFGKSVDWHHGHDRVASAKMGNDGYYDVFTMDPDGSNVRILTRGLNGCPQKHNGNPCFHPSGKSLVFTGQNEQLPDDDKAVRRVAVPGSGLGANLYVVDMDGSEVHQLTTYPLVPPLCAVIHPQFSKDGRKLAWAERIRDGDSFGGGWVMKLGDFNERNPPFLSNIKTVTPGNRECFYEVHDFSMDDKKLLFSGDLQEGQPHTGLDIYEMDLDCGKIIRLTHTDNDWDEHAHYSPDGKHIAWMSSTGFEIDYGSEKGQGVTWGEHLKTELWIMDRDGSSARQLTHFNTQGHPEYMQGARCIVSDSTWSPDGKSIIACVAWLKGRTKGVRLVKIELQ